jgi:hypothetical protein
MLFSVEPDERVLKAMANLRVNLDFAAVTEWLTDNKNDAVKVFAELSPADLVLFQGYAKTLVLLLDTIATASDVLEKKHAKK